MHNESKISWIAPVDNFDALEPDAKRVVIARDILRGLETDRLAACSRSYFAFDSTLFGAGDRVIKADNSVRDMLPDIALCQVCAIGAACAAIVGRVNQFGTGNFHQRTYLGDNIDASENDVRATLRRYFAPIQIAMMECAFMVEPAWALEEGVREFAGEIENSVSFGSRLPKARDRMIAIWENVIANNGEFCP